MFCQQHSSSSPYSKAQLSRAITLVMPSLELVFATLAGVIVAAGLIAAARKAALTDEASPSVYQFPRLCHCPDQIAYLGVVLPRRYLRCLAISFMSNAV